MKYTLGQKVADAVASGMGSWRFIIIQSGLLTMWVGANIIGYIQHWDPYPFILLNLVLSFQAAYAAPIIMMAQNRQADIDRRKEARDHEINALAEKEIRHLHTKFDLLREREIAELIHIIHRHLELKDEKKT